MTGIGMPMTPGMDGAIAASSSAITAAQRSLAVTADDLAAWSSGHAAVPSVPDAGVSAGPTDRRVVLRATEPGVAADVVSSDRAISGIDEAVELVTTPRMMESNAAVLRTAVATYESVVNLVPRSSGEPDRS